MDATQQTILAFLATGPKTAAEIVPEVYRELEACQVREPGDDCIEFTDWELEMMRINGDIEQLPDGRYCTVEHFHTESTCKS